MKLKNKKTGEIRKARIFKNHLQLWVEALNDWVDYDDIDYLATYWERYEEPKEYWYVSAYGNLAKTDVMTDLHRGAEEIGNLFDTWEEAEKAIEKLKAWKRLKDKGFEITGFEHIGANGWVKGKINFLIPKDNLDEADLDLLFGGEK